MPNSDTAAALVETATKCFATAAVSPPSAASAQSWASVEGVATSHAERFARTSRARTPFARTWSEITIQQARAPVEAPNMSIFDRPDSDTTQSRHSEFAKAGLTNHPT
jgi:hypothetical protein